MNLTSLSLSLLGTAAYSTIYEVRRCDLYKIPHPFQFVRRKLEGAEGMSSAPRTPRPTSPSPATTPAPAPNHPNHTPPPGSSPCASPPSEEQVDYSFSPSPGHSTSGLGCVRGESSPTRHADSRRASYLEALLSPKAASPVNSTDAANGQAAPPPQVCTAAYFRDASTPPSAPPRGTSGGPRLRSVVVAPNRPPRPDYFRATCRGPVHPRVKLPPTSGRARPLHRPVDGNGYAW